MVSGGGAEDGVPPGLFGPFEGGDPLWREDGDEETLPLLRNEEQAIPSYDPFLPGPWVALTGPIGTAREVTKGCLKGSFTVE